MIGTFGLSQLLFLAFYIVVLVYVLGLANRFVKAIERIAERM